jgi:serine protease Do
MQYYAAGTTVDVKVERAENGQYTEKTISVTLGKKPASSQTDSSDSSNSGSDNSTMPNGQNQRNGR